VGSGRIVEAWLGAGRLVPDLAQCERLALSGPICVANAVQKRSRFTIVHRDTFSSCSRPVEAKWRLACGFAYACPAKMPGDGDLNATAVRAHRMRPRGKISQHNVTVWQRSVLTINTCVLTTA